MKVGTSFCLLSFIVFIVLQNFVGFGAAARRASPSVRVPKPKMHRRSLAKFNNRKRLKKRFLVLRPFGRVQKPKLHRPSLVKNYNKRKTTQGVKLKITAYHPGFVQVSNKQRQKLRLQKFVSAKNTHRQQYTQGFIKGHYQQRQQFIQGLVKGSNKKHHRIGEVYFKKDKNKRFPYLMCKDRKLLLNGQAYRHSKCRRIYNKIHNDAPDWVKQLFEYYKKDLARGENKEKPMRNYKSNQYKRQKLSTTLQFSHKVPWQPLHLEIPWYMRPRHRRAGVPEDSTEQGKKVKLELYTPRRVIRFGAPKRRLRSKLKKETKSPTIKQNSPNQTQISNQSSESTLPEAIQDQKPIFKTKSKLPDNQRLSKTKVATFIAGTELTREKESRNLVMNQSAPSKTASVKSKAPGLETRNLVSKLIQGHLRKNKSIKSTLKSNMFYKNQDAPTFETKMEPVKTLKKKTIT